MIRMLQCFESSILSCTTISLIIFKLYLVWGELQQLRRTFSKHSWKEVMILSIK